MTGQTPVAPPDGARRPPRDDQIDVFGLTHRGKVRPTNQDHFLLCSLHKTMRVRATSLPRPELLETTSERLAFLGMVADGVGGSRGGEQASRAALEAVASYATHTMQCYYSADPEDHQAFLEALLVGARHAHEAVISHGLSRPDIAGLATTLTAAISVGPSFYLLQIGDSRAYRLHNGVLERLTRDQTLAQDLVDQGVLAAERLERSPYTHVLSSAIGGDVRPVVSRVTARHRDVLMLCTDGLTKHVADDQIQARLATMTSAEQGCRLLIEDALAGGGTDNVTVLIGRSVS